MDYTDIQNIEEVEATRLDFKEKVELTKAKSWLKTVVAFANTDGGHIVFGVTDDHKFVGLENPQEASSKISEKIVSMVSPNPLFTLTQIGGFPKGVVCIDLKVEAGPDYPYRYVNSQSRQAFVRRGDRSEKASDVELNALILRGQNRTYDALPSSYKLSDVSFTLLAATFKKMTGDDFDMTKDLESMGLIDSSGRVTNAGLLMCDQGYLRQSVVVCTRWKGLEKGAVDGDALDDKEYRDASLITLLSNAEDFIRTNSKNRWTIRGMVREEKSDYPFKAVREVLVNALIHRNYQILGTEIHVDIFDDRMEIMSPGGMMSGSRIQNMNKEHIPSMRRNEKISDIFGRLGFMDRRGSGIQRILNSYKNYSQEPTFYSDESIFLVTMPNRSFTGAKRVQKIPPQYTAKVMLANKSKGQITEKGSLTKEVSGQKVEKSALANKSKGQIAKKGSLTKEVGPQIDEKVTLTNKVNDQTVEKSSLMKEVSGQTSEKSALANKVSGQKVEKSALANKVSGQTVEKGSLTKEVGIQTDEKSALTNKVSGQTAEKSALANKASGQTAEKSALANKVSGQTAKKSALANKVSGQTAEKSALANKVSGQTAEKSALANKLGGQTAKKCLLANKVGVQNVEKSFSEYEIKAEDLPIRLDPPAVDNIIDAIVKKCKRKNRQGPFQARTLEKLANFYMKYKSDYSFNRDALAAFFNIRPDAATRIIRKCCNLGIMRQEKRSVYFFINLD